MKWIDQDYTLLEQGHEIDDMFQQIETAGRVCYKSVGTRYFFIPIMAWTSDYCKHFLLEGLIANSTDCFYSGDTYIRLTCDGAYISIRNSILKRFPKNILHFECKAKDHPEFFMNVTAHDFVQMLKDSGHLAMLEHGTVFLKVPCLRLDIFLRYCFNKYTRVKFYKGEYLITTNYRVICEKNDENMMTEYWCWTPKHYTRPSVLFIMDRVGSQSVERHRGKYGISFAQESTRYCNYSKSKFSGLTFIIPRWMYKIKDFVYDKLTGNELIRELSKVSTKVDKYCKLCASSEKTYLDLLSPTAETSNDALTPQDARGVLPLQIKTEFIMTAFMVDWKHFFELRDEHSAHPDIQYIAHKLHNEPVFKDI